MDCPTCEAMVESYLDGELPAGESARFEAALAECPECRAKLERLQAQRALIRGLPVARAPDLLRARIERELRIGPALRIDRGEDGAIAIALLRRKLWRQRTIGGRTGGGLTRGGGGDRRGLRLRASGHRKRQARREHEQRQQEHLVDEHAAGRQEEHPTDRRHAQTDGAT